MLDSSIANVALPTIGQELGISSADSIWIVNAYQLAIMVSLLSFSALGDVVGYRKVYIGGLMLFTVASVGCALSSSLATLVLARVMQGFGAAAITSVNTSLIRFIYPKARLGRGMGINAIDSLRGNRLMLRGVGLNEKELEILGVKYAGE